MLVIACCVLFGAVESQTLVRPLVLAGLSPGAYSTRHADVFSWVKNQAALARVRRISVGLAGERRFMLPGLQSFQAVWAIPMGAGSFGLQLARGGLQAYRENQLALAYGRPLGDNVDLGLQFNYTSIGAGQYGQASALSFELGSVFHLTGKLHAGLQINNPKGGRFGASRAEQLPFVYTAGLGYDASDKFFVGADITREENQDPVFRVVFVYKPVSQVITRAGVATSITSYWLGAAFILQSFEFGLISVYHQQLGWSPGCTLRFFVRDKKENGE